MNAPVADGHRPAPRVAATDVHEIAIHLDEIAQLYDVLDPSPFPEKSLNAAVEAYLLDCAGEPPPSQRIELVVTGPPETVGASLAIIAAAVHAHFRYLLAQTERRWRRKSRLARGATLAGALVLAGAVALRGLIIARFPAAALTEGLLVIGWVAIGRPIEHLVFDRVEHRERCARLARLARIPTRFVAQRPPARDALRLDASPAPPGAAA